MTPARGARTWLKSSCRFRKARAPRAGCRLASRPTRPDRSASPARFAVRDWYFCFPNPGRLVLAHAGSSLASLPSLGRENYFRRIVHVAAARDLPLRRRRAPAARAAPCASSICPTSATPTPPPMVASSSS